jgi:hypothetical protein
MSIVTHLAFSLANKTLTVEAAIERGDDIVPTRTVVRKWEDPRRVADSQRGRVLGFAMERLSDSSKLIVITTCRRGFQATIN